MIDVVHDRCLECNKRPTYNYKDEKKGIYCKEHKKIGMVDIKHKLCIENGCNIRANFNYEGEKKGLYCKKHSLENMIDITNTKCKEEGC